jgi:hypothetical protein
MYMYDLEHDKPNVRELLCTVNLNSLAGQFSRNTQSTHLAVVRHPQVTSRSTPHAQSSLCERGDCNFSGRERE